MPSSSSTTSLWQLNDDLLCSLAGEGAFARGVKYAHEGRVTLQSCTSRQISGRVNGSQPYSVFLHRDGKSLYGDCSCPVGEGGDFCKHQVALALIARGDAEGVPATDSNLDAFLHAQSADLLADKLLAFAAQHREIEKDLVFWHKSSQAGSSADLNKVIGTLLRDGGFVDYRRSFDYAQRVDQVCVLLRGLAGKNPAQCAEASEYALLRLFKTLERSDDSAGAISGAIGNLAAVHLKALSTNAAAPDKKYGQRFFKLMLADDWGFFKLDQYRPVLGKQAWAEYGHCLEQACAKLPAPSKNHRGTTGADIDRRHLIRLLEDWYASGDDRDALLALKIRELQQPWDYAKLIEQFRQFGRHREALEWAEKSLHLFPDDMRFYVLLSESYRHDGCDEDADRVLWQWFEKWPSAQHFFELMRHAGKQAPGWRERAFAYLEHCEERNLKQRLVRDPKALRDVSNRLEILLQEKKIDAAVAVSREAVANGHLVLNLADMARKNHPEISIPIYRRHIESTVALGNNKAYDAGLNYLQKLLPLLKKAEREEYLQSLRSHFKAKRNFMKLLDTL